MFFMMKKTALSEVALSFKRQFSRCRMTHAPGTKERLRPESGTPAPDTIWSRCGLVRFDRPNTLFLRPFQGAQYIKTNLCHVFRCFLHAGAEPIGQDADKCAFPGSVHVTFLHGRGRVERFQHNLI